MKRTIILSLLLLACALLLPFLIPVSASGSRSGEPEVKQESGSGAESGSEAESGSGFEPGEKTAPALGQADSETAFTVLLTGEGTSETTMDKYLPGVVAAEMPASFETQALMAQAVAARTYILYRREHECAEHPEADVCDNAACCKAYASPEALAGKWGEDFEQNWGRVKSAASDTDGLYLTYENAPIQAVFHSSSAGRTEASGNIWTPLPYLVSVDSPETEAEVPNFSSSVEVSFGDFKAAVAAEYPEAVFGDEPFSWLGEVKYYDSGRVVYAEIGGARVSGTDLRRLFGLRSTAFTLEYSGSGLLFSVRGYGHGVGMSQYGANSMARSGSSFEDILSHYYPGTGLTCAGRT